MNSGLSAENADEIGHEFRLYKNNRFNKRLDESDYSGGAIVRLVLNVHYRCKLSANSIKI